MLFAMQNEIYKILLILFIEVILFSTIKTVSVETLVDIPLSIPSDSAKLHATLTGSNGADKYFIQEFISASDTYTRGKIVISGEKDSYNIYYKTASKLQRKRLIIHGTNCLLFTFKNNWDKTLPGISKPVTNLVLLMGPSILYRLDHSSLIWKEAEDKNIRGTMMKGATTEINKRLRITYYYKKHYKDDSGIKNPSRIEFSGYDPYSTSYSSRENLILDIYLQNDNYYDEFANEVYPTPGIGCPHYLSPDGLRFPTLKVKYLHYTMYETIQGSTTSRTFSEIYASEEHKILKLKTSLLGVTTEIIHDYELGISYIFEEKGHCNMQATDLNAPGINGYGFFYLNSLLDVDTVRADFYYLGKLNLEHRSGILVDAWEKETHNVKINGKEVDKAVITQYFAKSRKSEIFSGYTLVSTTITTYKLDSSQKTYTLIDKITRDYINFEIDGSEDALTDTFTLKDCKSLTSDKTLTLGFKFQCEGDSCDEILKKNANSMKNNFMHYVIKSSLISPLRIDTVEDNFNDGQFEIEVTFLDTPDLKSIVRPKTLYVDASTFRKVKRIEASDQSECLSEAVKVFDNIKVLIYSPSDSLCGYLTEFDDLKEDTKSGKQCSVYKFPLLNLRAIHSEVPLEKIHDEYLSNLGWGIQYRQTKFKIIDIVDKTANQDNLASGLFLRTKTEVKLKSNDQVTKILPDVKTFADCYRACHDSEQFICHTLSLCAGDSIDCRVSSLLTENFQDDVNIEQDKACSIYFLNVLNDYSEVPQRKFKSLTSPAVEKYLYSCAELCHASADCLSFQHCGYSCSFGGLYTDSATEYDEECSVYFPKRSQKYQKTGNKIVSEVIHTEMNLNLDQCASLCHGWSDGETGCKSFNYCPKSKTESSCSLTKFSVKNSDTKTIEGGECSNYELKEESKGKKSKESSSIEIIKGTSGSTAFGIIVLFLFVGGLLGFAAPIAYTKAKQLRNTAEVNEKFTWSKQVNESEANID